MKTKKETKPTGVIATADIRPSTTNPRKRFDDADLLELGESIKKHGQLQPILVRPNPKHPDESQPYEIVAGERRWRACSAAGVETMLAIVREISDDLMLEIQIVENVQRVDMDPLDESDAFQSFVLNKSELTQAEAAAEISKLIGKPREFVYQRLRLADLTDEAKRLLNGGLILLGHAIELSRLPEELQAEMITELCYNTVFDGRNRVRDSNPPIKAKITVSALKGRIASSCEDYRLSDMPWSVSDDSFKKCSSCITCPKRTGANASLFGDTDENDSCLDKKCFHQKFGQHIAKRLGQLREEGKTLVLLDQRMQSYSYRPRTIEGVPVYIDAFVDSKKDETRTVALVVQPGYGKDRYGQEFYVDLNLGAINRASGKTEEKSTESKDYDDKVRRWKLDTCSHFRSKIRTAVLSNIKQSDAQGLLSATAASRLTHFSDGSWQKLAKELGFEAKTSREQFCQTATLEQILQVLVLREIWYSVEPSLYETALKVSDQDQAVLTQLGLTAEVIKEFKTEALLEMPKPVDPSKPPKPKKPKKQVATTA